MIAAATADISFLRVACPALWTVAGAGTTNSAYARTALPQGVFIFSADAGAIEAYPYARACSASARRPTPRLVLQDYHIRLRSTRRGGEINRMTRQEAQRKYDALKRLTVARGATVSEAATASRLAAALAAKYSLNDEQPRSTRQGYSDARAEPRSTRHGGAPWPPPPPDEWDFRWEYVYGKASRKWRWEYRKCGKAKCWCARAHQGHGPYRYGKVRRGLSVHSHYVGR